MTQPDVPQGSALTPAAILACGEDISRLFADQSHFLTWIQEIMEQASAENASELVSSNETRPLLKAVPARRATLERLDALAAFTDARRHLVESLDLFEQRLTQLLESNRKQLPALTARAAVTLMRSGGCYERGKGLISQYLNTALERQIQELLETYSQSVDPRADG